MECDAQDTKGRLCPLRRMTHDKEGGGGSGDEEFAMDLVPSQHWGQTKHVQRGGRRDEQL